MMRANCLIAVLAAIAPSVAPADAREWTSQDGKYRVEAELVAFDTQRVQLKKADGTVVAVPLAQLSQADQQWIADLRGRREAAEKLLAEKGLRATSAGLVLADEVSLRGKLRDMPKLTRPLFDSARRLAEARARVEGNQAAITKLVQGNLQLTARLATIGPTDVMLNNRLVGAIKANEAQIHLLEEQAAKFQEQLKAARDDANRARETFIEEVLALRKLADGLVGQYEKLKSDRQVADTIAGLKAVLPGAYTLGDSPALAAALKQLAKLEAQILSESIPLRSDGGALYASVVIDGKHTQEMIVDSGASLTCLPLQVASACGIEIGGSSPEVVLEMADGRRVPGKLVTVKSIRLGKFSAENVQCAVLGAEAVNAAPLLGMSFLENFKFQIDAQGGTMTMVEVASVGKDAP